MTKALRQTLVDAGCLLPNGLIYATDYSQVEWTDNVTAANPASALAARGVTAA